MSQPQFVPKTLEENVNVSPEHPLREVGKLIAVAAGAMVGLYLLLGFASERVAERISFETEKRLFPDYSRFVKSGHRASSDQGARALQGLLEKMAGAESSSVAVTIQPLCSADLNAFAAPGGHVLITSELLKEVPSENGIAFVIAHELGHIRLRHPLKALGRGLSIYAMAALLGSFGDDMISTLARGSGELTALRFSREQEEEADRFAIESMIRSYGHLQGADELFSLIQAKHQLAQIVPDFLTTHPGTAERIHKIQRHPAYLAKDARTLPSPFKASAFDLCKDGSNSKK